MGVKNEKELDLACDLCIPDQPGLQHAGNFPRADPDPHTDVYTNENRHTDIDAHANLYADRNHYANPNPDTNAGWQHCR